ncbi:hypothetical protein CL614_10460 [archaeon]|jgi:hypothetical protein|nr:hypothetical protein [archaeon]|tara:strand:+ start:389 stop:1096 length:708 start_codon:yes stop_codon:yes gene_type:complete
MPNDKLEKLKKLLEMVNESITRKEFVESFKKVMDHVLKTETALMKKLNKFTKDVDKLLNSKTDDGLLEMKAQLTKDTKEMFEEQKQNLDFIKDKANRIVNGIDGLDGKDGLDGEPGKDGEAGKPGKDAKPIDKEDLIEEVLKRIPKGKGGGTSAIGIAQAFKWIAHTEEPSGDIDGANTDYTVKTNIWWIAGFTLNGEQIAELPNFTFVNKTITFSSALPAAYSGKDFEVKYIGT